MKITADTNLILRAVLEDDAEQARLAQSALSTASLVAVTVPMLCEFVWVLKAARKRRGDDIARAIRELVDSPNVKCDRAAVEAGLAMLESGGDFADGALAHQGRALGGETFLSFDRKAVAGLADLGHDARLPSARHRK